MYFVEGGRNSVPAGHCSGFDAAHSRHRGNHHASVPHGPANQHDFQLDECSHRNLFWAKKKNARRTDVSSDERYREVFGDRVYAPQPQGKLQRGTRILALFLIHTHGVSRHPHKLPGPSGRK